MAHSAKFSLDTIYNIPNSKLILGPGSEEIFTHKAHLHNRSFNIFASITDRALGEFIGKNLFCAAVKCQFDLAHLAVYYKNDRPYKDDIISLNPFIDTVLQLPGNRVLPIEFFYGFGDRQPLPGADEFIDRGLAAPDLILVPSMMHPLNILRFAYLPYFRIPPTREAELDQRLVELGIDPNRWFCCIYYREPTYKFRPATAYRDVAAEPFEKLTAWIIGECGGQVIRIGHPEMTPFPEREGFIDLSRLEDDFITQANAVSRARFGVVTGSGPKSLFGALGTPHALTNETDILAAWRETERVLPRHFFSPTGEALDITEAIRNGTWNDDTAKRLTSEQGYRSVDNTIEELQAVTEMMIQETADVVGWRPRRDFRADLKQVKTTNQHSVPAPMQRAVTIVQFPEFAPKPVEA